MNYAEVIEKLESCKDLNKDPQRLKDYIEVGRNIYLVEHDFEEGKRICTRAKEIALEKARKTKLPAWYEMYVLSLKYLARHFLDFDS